jgi:uncharacterized protein (TIGR02001 family)
MTKSFTTLTAAAAVLLAAGTANAADLRAKAPVVAAPPAPSMFDIAFGASLASDYIFRGISQSNREPSVSAYFEPRINFTPNLQGYVGVAGSSISFTNRAAAEIDLYGGLRATFGKLAVDVGGIYYYYPGGECYGPTLYGECANNVVLPSFNVAKDDASFFEFYVKPTFAVTDAFTIGGNFYYTDSYVNTGAEGFYYSGTAKYVFPTFANGVGMYVSGEYGYQDFGTTDLFYASAAWPAGTPLPDYSTWNVGLGFTYKVFTLDLRYYDTDLSKGDCNAITGDFSASQTGYVTSANPGGYGSKWCGATFVAKLSVDLTLDSLK